MWRGQGPLGDLRAPTAWSVLQPEEYAHLPSSCDPRADSRAWGPGLALWLPTTPRQAHGRGGVRATLWRAP